MIQTLENEHLISRDGSFGSMLHLPRNHFHKLLESNACEAGRLLGQITGKLTELDRRQSLSQKSETV